VKRPTVIIRDCPDYDVQRIRTFAREALETLDLRPHGRTLIKPNVVAAGTYFPNAFTRPEFVEGVVQGLQDRAESSLEELAIGERSGITMPTRYAYKNAHYPEMAKRNGVRLYHFDEVPQVEIPLYHEHRLRDSIFTPEPVARADFFVNCPKFKAHPWTTVTFSMKNYIGIQDDRHRLIDHDHALNRKVADLQYIVQPQFIAIDGIVAGEGRMLTPIPFDLRLMVMGDNQVAFDSVCCHMIGVDPMSVEHIRLAVEEGFGPSSLDEIDILGDLTFEEARARADGFRVGLIRVEEYFKDSKIRAYAGPPPSGKEDDYCWGGCPGALEEAIEILRVYDEGTDEKVPPMHVVFGAYDGEIDAKPGEKVIFMGDCASFHGEIAGENVDIDSVYVDRSEKDPLDAKHEGIYGKMAQVTWNLFKGRKQDVIRIHGCPVSVAEQTLTIVKLSKVSNPYLDSKEAVPFTSCYLSWRTRRMINRLFGIPYLREGATLRGAARPQQNLPAPSDSRTLEMKQTPQLS